MLHQENSEETLSRVSFFAYGGLSKVKRTKQAHDLYAGTGALCVMKIQIATIVNRY